MNKNDKNKLKKGVAGWFMLATLGVSYVISGSYAGWNYGIPIAGWSGMFIAVCLMGIMYFSLVLCLAEMSAAMPSAGGGYSIAKEVLGPIGGFATGLAVLIEYAIAPAAIVIFIGQYTNALWGIDGPILYALFYLVFIGIHLLGAGEALKIMLVITVLAIIAIIVTITNLIPHFQIENLISNLDAESGHSLFSFEASGVWAAFPFAMWLFLAVEGVPLAAEEAKNPTKDLPRGIIAAMLFLLVSAFSVMIFVPGAVGVELSGSYGAPLVEALREVYGENSAIASFVNVVGLAGLIASFFSIIYGYSRLVYSLASENYLPTFLSSVSAKKVPFWALIVPGIFGYVASLTGEGDLMIMIAVFGATISYALQAYTYIKLRLRNKSLYRPYRAPGGIVTASIALTLSAAAFGSCFYYNLRAALFAGIIYFLGMTYYFVFKHREISKISSPRPIELVDK